MKTKLPKKPSLNYEIIESIIPQNAKILDIGCGDGELLERLKTNKNTQGQGIEIEQDLVISCIEKGLSVIQDNVDLGLSQFQDKVYDYVILNRTLQSTHKTEFVIEEMLRVGKKCIVSFPNFAYWRVRFYLFFNGKMPISEKLPYEWYNTPNIHLLTIKDFFDFAESHNFSIEKSIYLNKSNVKKGLKYDILANLFAEEVIFVISKN